MPNERVRKAAGSSRRQETVAAYLLSAGHDRTYPYGDLCAVFATSDAETDALAGAQTVVGQHHPSFAIDLHTPEQDVGVGAFLKAHGYVVFRINDEPARRVEKSSRLLLPVADLEHGWPARNGIWGSILAVHPSRSAAYSTAMALSR